MEDWNCTLWLELSNQTVVKEKMLGESALRSDPSAQQHIRHRQDLIEAFRWLFSGLPFSVNRRITHYFEQSNRQYYATAEWQPGP
jgi:hypothetical protein